MSRKPDDSFFIGWDKTPAIDRRFLLRAAGLALIGATGTGALLARAQQSPGDGSWDPTIREFAGVIVKEPYPVLRTTALDGTPRTAFLATSGKLGLQARLADGSDGPAVIRGSLIARGKHAMIAVEDEDWFAPWLPTDAERAPLVDWPEREIATSSRVGEILDAKCWFGAMRPGQGKPHKSCAALCIRGGLPPVLCADAGCASGGSEADGDRWLLLDENGVAHGLGILPLVADRVAVEGRVVQVGDVITVRVPLSEIRRI